MDFIKKLISGIFGFLGSILGSVTGLLPGKKKSSDYFLELDEAKDTVKEVASNAKKAVETVASSAKKVTETIVSDTSKPASLNGTKAKSTQNPKPADVELVQTAEGLKVQPGNNAKAAAAKVLKEQPTETTFAPKYLAPSATSSNGRRRPGANMSAYLDMARQVKTPKN
jgi:gas vesicle protein